MTRYGKINLLGMLLLPVAATVAAQIESGNETITVVKELLMGLVLISVGGRVGVGDRPVEQRDAVVAFEVGRVGQDQVGVGDHLG